MSTGLIIQARMSSSRLPGKVMKKLSGKEVLWHMVTRCRLAKNIDHIVVATSIAKSDDVIYKFCRAHSFPVYRGSLNDVSSRYYKAAKKYRLNTIIRITADCPLIQPEIIDLCLKKFVQADFDYLSNYLFFKTYFPIGQSVEIFSLKTLELTYKNATTLFEREHISPYVCANKNGQFKIAPLVKALPAFARNYRLTLDYPQDYKLISSLYDKFYLEGEIVDLKKVIRFLDKHPKFLEINAQCKQLT